MALSFEEENINKNIWKLFESYSVRKVQSHHNNDDNV